MGLQVTCPLCGFNRPPEQFEARPLNAKNVRSLGGNRGFEHVETAVPDDVRADIVEEVERLHRMFGERSARTPPNVGPEIEAEVEAAIEDRLQDAEVERAVETAVREGVNGSEGSASDVAEEIAREVDRAMASVVAEEVGREVERAIRDNG